MGDVKAVKRADGNNRSGIELHIFNECLIMRPGST